MSSATPITISRARESVRATFPDASVFEGPLDAPVEHYLKAHRSAFPAAYNSEMMGAIVDGRLRELAYPLRQDATIAPVLASDSDGRRIYRRSLVLLLTVAVTELFPEARVSVSYAVPDGGYYCLLRGHEPLSDAELQQLEARMREIASADEPITRRIVPISEAVALYQARGDENKLRLLESRSRTDLVLYTLRGYSDYYYGYMLPSTGYLQLFRLFNTDSGGFIVQYPRSAHPGQLGEPIDNQGKICQIFDRAEQLLTRLNVEDVGRLNQIVRGERVQELILVAETEHEQQIARIASQVYEAHHERSLRLVLIAGPSSSGKTTFAKRLAIHLLAHGLRPFTLELDNYFVDREHTPRDAQGKYDFESLEAINLPLFNQQLKQLISGEEVRLPRFDFKRGKSMTGQSIRLDSNHILIVEGIHGINPQLVSEIPAQAIYRIYVSALTAVNLDPQNRIPTTDVRLLRRICRDAVQRGHNATATITMWPSVRRGEKRNIFPYQENASVIFNSALIYEVASLRPIAEPLLLQVAPGTPAHIESNRLLSFLRWVEPLTPAQQALIPDTSLLREFTGGSILESYLPGDLTTRDV